MFGWRPDPPEHRAVPEGSTNRGCSPPVLRSAEAEPAHRQPSTEQTPLPSDETYRNVMNFEAAVVRVAALPLLTHMFSAPAHRCKHTRLPQEVESAEG